MENKLEYDYDVILCKKCGMKYPKEIEENHKNFCNNFCKNCQSCPYCLKDIPIKLYDSHILRHYNISDNNNDNNDLLDSNNNNINNINFENENNNIINNNNNIINNNNNNIINNNNNIINNNNNIINNNNNIINNNFQNNIINNNQNNFNNISNDNNYPIINNNKDLSEQFFDIENESKRLENEKIEKELYEKKILGIVKDVKNTKKKSLKDKLKDNFKDIELEDGLIATLDIIGCVFLVSTSITRTGIRLINLVQKLTEKNEENGNNNLIENNENGLSESQNNNIEKIIETLPTSILKKKIENSSIQCIICMEDFNVGDKVSTLPCFHVFHSNCIDKWLLKTHSCPICKFKVTMNSLIMNYEKLYKDK